MVVAAQRELLCSDKVGGHDHRHLLPEIGRVADLSTRRCEQLCYWRQQGVVGESEADQAALARAVAAARAAPRRGGPLAWQSDRYASVDAVIAEGARRHVRPVMPRFEEVEGEMVILLPGDTLYPDENGVDGPTRLVMRGDGRWWAVGQAG